MAWPRFINGSVLTIDKSPSGYERGGRSDMACGEPVDDPGVHWDGAEGSRKRIYECDWMGRRICHRYAANNRMVASKQHELTRPVGATRESKVTLETRRDSRFRRFAT